MSANIGSDFFSHSDRIHFHFLKILLEKWSVSFTDTPKLRLKRDTSLDSESMLNWRQLLFTIAASVIVAGATQIKFRGELQNKAAFPKLARSGHFEETCCGLLKETLGTFADFRKNLKMFGLTELVSRDEKLRRPSSCTRR